MNPNLAACAIAGLLGVVPAQSTIFVGPGGLPQIADAIVIANPGDTILVAPGTYGLFSVMKAVTIKAITPQTVTVVGFLCFAGPPPGATLHLVDLTVMAPLIVGQGHVALDRCSLQGAPPLLVTNASAHLQGCTLTAPPGFFSYIAALCAVDSQITAVDSTCTGVGGLGLALDLTRSTFHGSHMVLEALQATNVVIADAPSRIWLTDSTVTGASSGCPIPAGSGRMARCIVTPSCSTLPSAPAIGIHRPQRLQIGTSFVLDFLALPAEPIAVFASPALGTSQSSLIEQPLLLDPTDTWLAFMLTADSQGRAQMVWNVPAVPGFVNSSLWFQGLGLANQPMQASLPAGGLLQ